MQSELVKIVQVHHMVVDEVMCFMTLKLLFLQMEFCCGFWEDKKDPNPS